MQFFLLIFQLALVYIYLVLWYRFYVFMNIYYVFRFFACFNWFGLWAMSFKTPWRGNAAEKVARDEVIHKIYFC